jgi:hypothetical protein
MPPNPLICLGLKKNRSGYAIACLLMKVIAVVVFVVVAAAAAAAAVVVVAVVVDDDIFRTYSKSQIIKLSYII